MSKVTVTPETLIGAIDVLTKQPGTKVTITHMAEGKYFLYLQVVESLEEPLGNTEYEPLDLPVQNFNLDRLHEVDQMTSKLYDAFPEKMDVDTRTKQDLIDMRDMMWSAIHDIEGEIADEAYN